MKEKILELRALGYTYDAIVEELGCSKGTVAYHCNPEVKRRQHERQNDRRKTTTRGAVQVKLTCYTRRQLKDKVCKFRQGSGFSWRDVIAKFGDNPTCYLTGTPIDWTQPSTYHFDHIIPVSRGGQNTLDNLGICTAQVNIMKSAMTPEELISMCKLILKHNEQVA